MSLEQVEHVWRDLKGKVLEDSWERINRFFVLLGLRSNKLARCQGRRRDYGATQSLRRLSGYENGQRRSTHDLT